MFENVFIIIFLIFILFIWLYAFIKPLEYGIHLKAIRRTLYVLFVVVVGIGIMNNSLDLSSWRYLITLMAMIIFVDITVLMTPSILKIWQTEFQTDSEFFEETILKNERIQRAMVTKVGIMSVILQESNYYFEKRPIPNDRNQYVNELNEFVNQYCQEFGLYVQIRDLSITEFDLEIDIKEKIKQDLQKIDRINNFGFKESNIVEYVEALYNTEIISLVDNDSMLVPIYLEDHSLIIVLKNNKGILLEVDGVHIANLVHLFDSYM